MIHELKTWPEPFEAIASRRKTHEVRKADRPFQAGDVLRLREWDPTDWAPLGELCKPRGYTGREVYVEITYVTQPGTWGLPANTAHHTFDQEGDPLAVVIPGLCVLSIRNMTAEQVALELGVDKVRQDQGQRDQIQRTAMDLKHPSCLSDCSAPDCCGGCRT